VITKTGRTGQKQYAIGWCGYCDEYRMNWQRCPNDPYGYSWHSFPGDVFWEPETEGGAP
jgi:hypothetical protein